MKQKLLPLALVAAICALVGCKHLAQDQHAEILTKSANGTVSWVKIDGYKIGDVKAMTMIDPELGEARAKYGTDKSALYGFGDHLVDALERYAERNPEMFR